MQKDSKLGRRNEFENITTDYERGVHSATETNYPKKTLRMFLSLLQIDLSDISRF